MNTKNNQRYREMDIRLKSTLLRLMKDMEFDKITVKKICETAQVNRSTFYAHYTDIYDMLEQIEEFLSNELNDSFSAKEIENITKLSDWPFILLLEHIKKHKRFYTIALQHRNHFPLQNSFESIWMNIIRPQCEKAGIFSTDEMMYYFIYFRTGLTMVLKRWIDTGCHENEEQMAQLITNCLPAVLI